MLEYEILVENDLSGLEKEVREYITTGWEPLGGVSITTDNDGGHAAQVMIRKPKRCPHCGGKGFKQYHIGSPEKLTACPACDGTGTAPCPPAGSPGMKHPINLPCPECEGTGTIPSPPEVLDNNDPIPCPECKGTGKRQEETARNHWDLILNLQAVSGNDPLGPLCHEAAKILDAQDAEIKDLKEKLAMRVSGWKILESP